MQNWKEKSMETKTINDYDELVEFTMQLASNDKVSFDITSLPDQSGWVVKWIKLKTYTTHDGKEFLDEAWVTKAGEMILIQDIGLDHCRNIIRMMIRNQREQALAVLKATLSNTLESFQDDDDLIQTDIIADEGRGKYLH